MFFRFLSYHLVSFWCCNKLVCFLRGFYRYSSVHGFPKFKTTRTLPYEFSKHRTIEVFKMVCVELGKNPLAYSPDTYHWQYRWTKGWEPSIQLGDFVTLTDELMMEDLESDPIYREVKDILTDQYAGYAEAMAQFHMRIIRPLEFVVKNAGSYGTADPLDQRTTIGWKAAWGI